MKIIFYGNAGNIGLRIVEWLRKKGQDAELVMFKEKSQRSLPEWEQPSLKSGYPDWINVLNSVGGLRRLFPSLLTRNKLNRADVILTTGIDVLGALKCDAPVIFFPIGSDITEIPFRCSTIRDEIISIFYRKRIGNVKKILTVQEDCIWSARLLSKGESVIPFFLPVSIEKIRRNIDTDKKRQLNQVYSKYDAVILCLSRKNCDPSNRAYKGQEKILSAVAKYIKDHPQSKIRLICGTHGLNVRDFLDELNNLGLQKYSDLVDQLPLPDLHAYQTLNNAIILDQFGSLGSQSLGGISREGLAVGGYVVTATDTRSESFIRAYGSGCPLVPAFNEEDIYRAIKDFVLLTPQEREMCQKKAIKWSEKFLDWHSHIDHLINILNQEFELSRK